MSKVSPIAVAFFGLLWAQLVYALHLNWQGHSYYDFGWFVAFILVYFVLSRCRECSDFRCQAFPPAWRWLIIAFLVTMLIPLRIVEHVDPFWRLPLWIHGFLFLAIFHSSAGLLLGSKNSFHLLPATLLIFLVIPLPSRVEQAFVNSLTDWVTHFTSAVLPFAGYPVEQIGNTFLVGDEVVDVAESCSGIRSFQSCLAAGFVLGELQRLSLSKRLFLLLASIGLAVLTNTARVLLLVRITDEHGKEVMDAAHDQLGFWAAVITFLLIGILSWLLDQTESSPRHPKKRMTDSPSSVS